MTRQELRERRAKIVRRWTALRVSRAQCEIWRKRRARVGKTDDETVDEIAGDVDILAGLPDALLG